MPLPDGGVDVPWPPVHTQLVRDTIAEHSAWYSGDTTELTAIYGGTSGVLPPAGGLVPTLKRWFWGAPAAAGQTPAKLHVPVASDIATASADLLFAQEVGITWADAATQKRVDDILEANRWASLLPESGEVGAALSHVFLRCTWNLKIDPRYPILDVVHPDSAVPEFAYGRLQSVVFWREVRVEGQRVWRHLESHDPGRITHGLFEGDRAKLGRAVPLTESRATEHLALAVDEQASIPTGYPGLSTVYVPNMNPARKWRKDRYGCHLGRSDLEGIEGLLDAVDETMTSWMRDVRLGKSRIIVPDTFLAIGKPGAGSTFNVDQEAFVGLRMPPGEKDLSGGAITVQQFAIRTQEHADTMRGILGHAFRSAGYSAQTFGLADDTASTQTATEVNSRDQRSEVTREKKTRYWTDALRAFLVAVAAIDAEQFKKPNKLEPPVVEFPPSSQPSQQEVGQAVQMFRAAELMSTEIGVRAIHPEWEDKAVLDEVARIMAERKAAQPVFADPFSTEPDPDAPPADNSLQPA